MPTYILPEEADLNENLHEIVKALTFEEIYKLYQKALAQLCADFVQTFGEEITRKCIEYAHKK